MKKSRHSLLTVALLGAASLTSSHAANITWTGGSGNDNWRQNNNWGGDATNFTDNDNVSFTDSGLTPRPTIVVNGGAATVGTMTVSNTTGTYNINANGSNTLTGTTLTKSGAGTLAFGQNGNVTFANTTLNGGTLIIRQQTFNGGVINLTGNTTVGNQSNGFGTLAGTSLTGASVLNIEPYGGGAFVLGQTLDTSNFTGTIRSSVAGRVNVLNSSANLEQAKVELSGGATFQTQSTVTVKIGEITADSSSKLGSAFSSASIYEIGGRNTLSSIAGVIQNGGFANNGNTTTGSIALTKVGTGTLSLTGANTYTGATTVNAGTLLLGDGASGSLGTTATTVNAGEFFGNLASGVITAGAVTIGNSTGGTDAVFGAGKNVLGRFASSNSLTLNSDASFVFDLNSGTELTDTVTFGGAVALNGIFTLSDLNVGAINWSVNDSFTVVSGSSLTGAFANLANNAIISENGVDYQASYSSTALTLTVVGVIPEPATGALIIAGLALTTCGRRRLVRH